MLQKLSGSKIPSLRLQYLHFQTGANSLLFVQMRANMDWACPCVKYRMANADQLRIFREKLWDLS